MKQKNDMAWEKFLSTGRIDDYLKYCVCKIETRGSVQEEKNDASKHRRVGDTRTEYR